MQDAVPVGQGYMIAVLGQKLKILKINCNLLKKNDSICEIANDNAEGQVIVSGEKSVLQFQLLLKEKN